MTLPAPNLEGPLSLEATISKRRSVREYSEQPLDLGEVSQLVWAAQGMTGKDGKKSAPSAGGVYPLQLYLMAGSVRDLDTGLYRYEVPNHALTRLSESDSRRELRETAFEEQPWLAHAAVVLVIVADLARATEEFHEQPPEGERGYRYACMEVGSVAQNVYLQATALDLGVVFVGGFDETRVAELLGISKTNEPVGLVAIGKIKRPLES